MGGVFNSFRVSQHEPFIENMASTSDLGWNPEIPMDNSLTHTAKMSQLDLAYQNALHQTNGPERNRPSVSLLGVCKTNSQSFSASDSDSVMVIERQDMELSSSCTSCIYSSSSSGENQLKVKRRWVTYAQESPCGTANSITAQSLSQANPSRSSVSGENDTPWAAGFL